MWGGVFEELSALFSPGTRHLQRERERLATTRDEEGDSAPPPGPIDLDGGVVVIRRPGGPAEPPAPRD